MKRHRLITNTIVFENWCVDQAEVKSSLRIRRRVLHIQHFCIDVVGDTAFGFWCQYVSPHCKCIPHHFLIPGQVSERSSYPGYGC